MRKINRKDNFQFLIFNFHSILKFQILNFKFLIFTLLSLLLIYTRFVNIGWGLPYPMHPDERNMAVAIQGLNCKISNFPYRVNEFRISNFRECGNPHFFAYGQFPLYLGYIGVWIMKFFDGDLGTPISFQEAVFSLRFISAFVSIITAIILYRIICLFLSRKSFLFHVLCFMIVTFSPVLIQFAHFGTTESLLILFYSLLIYYSLLAIQKKLLITNFLLLASFFFGLALATKVSSVILLILSICVLIRYVSRSHNKLYPSYAGLQPIGLSKQLRGVYTDAISIARSIILLVTFLLFATIFFIVFSPHTIISFKEFLSSMQYESAVALGRMPVFYTRQFDQTIPIIFQLTKIFPYTLGLPVFLLGLLGFFFSSWIKKEFNLLRIAFVIVFFPNAFMYAKWTRFMAPAFPIFIIFATLFLSKIRLPRFTFYALCFIALIPGIAYLSIYRNSDVRFQASQWIYKNVPEGSRILSETANVVDLPLSTNNYRIISFNFYDLDKDPLLQGELQYYIQKADYIIVPSRRIFKNNIKQYPLLYSYYQNLFAGKLDFNKVAEFRSYPKLFFEFPDEDAEETWTVFDHPVIRIFERKQFSNLKLK